MGICCSRKKLIPINDKCPICFIYDKEHMIILKCRHQFDLECIQRACQNYLYERKTINCSICRKKISNNEIEKIFKEGFSFIPTKPDFWIRNDVHMLNYIVNIDIKYKYIENTIGNNNYQLIIPQFKIDNLYQPLFLKYELSKLEILPHPFKSSIFSFISDRNICNNLNGIDLILGGLTINNNWNELLSIFVRKFKHNNLRNIQFDLIISSAQIPLIVSNEDKIITYDLNDITYSGDFILKENRKCTVMFSPYLINYNNELYVYNRLLQVMYL
jgi:hypothetical protein